MGHSPRLGGQQGAEFSSLLGQYRLATMSFSISVVRFVDLRVAMSFCSFGELEIHESLQKAIRWVGVKVGKSLFVRGREGKGLRGRIPAMSSFVLREIRIGRLLRRFRGTNRLATARCGSAGGRPA